MLIFTTESTALAVDSTNKTVRKARSYDLTTTEMIGGLPNEEKRMINGIESIGTALHAASIPARKPTTSRGQVQRINNLPVAARFACGIGAKVLPPDYPVAVARAMRFRPAIHLKEVPT